MRGYYKKRIDELRAPSLTTNRPPSVSRLIPDRKTINMLKGRIRKPGTSGSVASKGDPRDAKDTVADKTPKTKTPVRPSLGRGSEPERLNQKPSADVTRREAPSKTQSKAEEPTQQRARTEAPPTQDPARPRRKVSPEAEASLRKKAKMEGPEGESARAAMKRMGLEESLRRLGRLIVGLL